ncbi:hypothetical protein K440DRAFT_671930 [Wilcoxina mikolae CBS 423.85]|nr:hypothetical protein K440DRAFT_671930 [Wilcoxina mikolae CBS 423.85]
MARRILPGAAPAQSAPMPVRTSSGRLSRPTTKAAEMQQLYDEPGLVVDMNKAPVSNGSGSNRVRKEVMRSVSKTALSTTHYHPYHPTPNRSLQTRTTNETARNRDQRAVMSGHSRITPSASNNPNPPAFHFSPTPSEKGTRFDRIVESLAQRSKRPPSSIPPALLPSIDYFRIQKLGEIIKLGLKPHTIRPEPHPTLSTKHNTRFVYAAYEIWKNIVLFHPHMTERYNFIIDDYYKTLVKQLKNVEKAYVGFHPRPTKQLQLLWPRIIAAVIHPIEQKQQENLWVFMMMSVLDVSARYWLKAVFTGTVKTPPWDKVKAVLEASVEKRWGKLVTHSFNGLTNARWNAERCLERDEFGNFYDDDGYRNDEIIDLTME